MNYRQTPVSTDYGELVNTDVIWGKCSSHSLSFEFWHAVAVRNVHHPMQTTLSCPTFESNRARYGEQEKQHILDMLVNF